MVAGILIGTAILWGLTLFVIQPLARALAEKDGALQASTCGGGTVDVEAEVAEAEVPASYFILVDVAVLGVAGLLIGLVSGYFFVGLAWGWVRWPGLLTFIAASLVGAMLHGPA